MTPEPTPPNPPPADPAAWLTPGRCAALLALLVFAMFPGVILGRDTFVIRDFGLFSLPVAHFQRECFWRGELPLWNPLSSCGMPFLAQWNTMALYPPALIYLLLPLTWSLPFFCLAHLFWGGFGMYRLTRAWTNHSFAAGLAAVVFAFNGLSLNFLMWPSHIATFSWLPWVIWFGQRACRAGGRMLVWATLAGALQMLAGGPETIFLTWFILMLLVLGESFIRSAPRGKMLLRFVSLVVLVTLLCGAQLLPFLRLLASSQRDSGFSVSDWAMPAWGWANFLVPLFRTAPTEQGLFMQVGQYWTSSYYAGIFTVVLVALAAARVRHWRVWLLGALLMVSLLLALGNASPVYRWLKAVVPALGAVRYPVKFAILILASCAPLAAFGFAALDQLGGKGRRFLVVGAMAGLLAVAGILLADVKFPMPGRNADATLGNGLERGFFLLALAGLAVGYLQARERLRIILGLALLAGVWLDLARHVPPQNPVAQPAIYRPGWASAQNQWSPPPRHGESRVMLGGLAQQALRNIVLPDVNKNYLLSRKAFLADCNLLEGVPQMFGFFSLTPREAYRATMLPYVNPKLDFPALLDFMSVTHTTAAGKASEWERRPSAMPMVTTGQRPVFADDAAVMDSFFETNLNLREVAFLPLATRAFVTATQQTSARILETHFTNQRVKVVAEASAPSLVVISQSSYPAWNASVDGKPVRLLRANYAFQAVEIPAGRHEVVLKYEDLDFRRGLCATTAGLLICVGLWFTAVRGIHPGMQP